MKHEVSEPYRSAMREKRMTAKDLSRESGISYSTVLYIIHNKAQKSSFDKIVQLYNVLGIPDRVQFDDQFADPLSAEEKLLISNFRQMNAQEKQVISRMLNSYAGR